MDSKLQNILIYWRTLLWFPLDHAEVVDFKDESANLKPIKPTQKFCCWFFELKAGSPNVGGIIDVLLTSPEICMNTVRKQCFGDLCHHRGVYNPNSHCQWYCVSCSKWFHIGCLRNSIDYHPMVKEILGHPCPGKFLEHIWHAWVPIERGGGLSGLVGNV